MARWQCCGAGRLHAVLMVISVGGCFLVQPCAAATQRQIVPNADELTNEVQPDTKYYFFNELTQETQWDDPGGVPYEEESGIKYWLGKHGEHLDQDPQAHHYTWLESFSEEHERPFFYNQETQVSTWERPPDLAEACKA